VKEVQLQITLPGVPKPRPVQRVWIPKLDSKELRSPGVPEVEDRVVQMALSATTSPFGLAPCRPFSLDKNVSFQLCEIRPLE
jgi:hypothetical protein